MEDGHESIRELLGAFALDAVDPEERRSVEQHLEGCPACQAEVDEHREMAAALGNGVVSLPPHLWDRIAGGITPTPAAQHPAPPSRLGDTGSPDPSELPIGPAPATSRAEAPDRRRVVPIAARARTRRWALGALGAAAAVLITVLFISLTHTDDRLDQAHQALAGRSGTAATQAATATPGHRLVALRSPTGAEVARIVVLPSGRGYLVSSSLGTLPRNETYQLWAMSGSKAISLGLLGPDPAGAAFTLASGHPEQLAITVEPAGGVTSPDHLPLAAGPLSV